jgi:pimeloyl-ACP methyl ester carboxylesterase
MGCISDKSKAFDMIEDVQNIFSFKKDKYKTLLRIITDYGFPFEKHYYETQDEYINCLHRISGPKETTVAENRKRYKQRPVLLYQHGLLDSSAGACANGPDNSLAFFFAEAGYDVWMNNARGNLFSRQHVSLDPDAEEDKKFWDFSFQDMASKDLPACISFILKKTGVSSLTYAGHSQGTTQCMASMCENPDFFRERVNLFIMMAPVAKVKNMKAEVFQKIKNMTSLMQVLEKMGPELFPVPQADGKVVSVLLKHSGISLAGMITACDTDIEHISQDGLETMLGHSPAGSTVQQIDHFRQLVCSGNFQKYDYGKEKNLSVYGEEIAPHYDLSQLHHFPIALFCGREDLLSSTEDYTWLSEELEKA